MAGRIEMTVKEYADRERVHPQTVRHWIRKGALPVRRTPGGGLRVVIFSLSDDEHMCALVSGRARLAS